MKKFNFFTLLIVILLILPNCSKASDKKTNEFLEEREKAENVVSKYNSGEITIEDKKQIMHSGILYMMMVGDFMVEVANKAENNEEYIKIMSTEILDSEELAPLKQTYDIFMANQKDFKDVDYDLYMKFLDTNNIYMFQKQEEARDILEKKSN